MGRQVTVTTCKSACALREIHGKPLQGNGSSDHLQIFRNISFDPTLVTPNVSYTFPNISYFTKIIFGNVWKTDVKCQQTLINVYKCLLLQGSKMLIVARVTLVPISVIKVCFPNLTHQHITPTSYPTSKRLYYPTSKGLYHLNQTYKNIYKHL